MRIVFLIYGGQVRELPNVQGRPVAVMVSQPPRMHHSAGQLPNLPLTTDRSCSKENQGLLYYSFSGSALFFSSSGSNGNSSSWSSLGLEGELYEDNLSFPTSDSDGPDDKDEDHEDDGEGLGQDRKILLITNIDMEPCTVDPQLRIILQWLVASEAEVAELYLHDSAKKEFIQVSTCLTGWS
ncbi:A-kinase anchor protein 11-like [Leptonychotes weddellii]|uniref:A-kinase anchor protein 11-like n=1 Tax=Leptonychotes weddellii TaxID=9713 RepID=A0A7F8RGP0_LEPWE|nr:A-kinase anchor protein 11-like [Leptonychotes weddellii]